MSRAAEKNCFCFIIGTIVGVFGESKTLLSSFVYEQM